MKLKIVKFRVDSEQFETLKRNAMLKGHVSIASYLRELAFKKSFVFEEMISEIHEEVVNGRRNKIAGLDKNIGETNC